MGDYMDRAIVKFPTQEEAKVYADKLHADNIAFVKKQGYIIINNEIVGKNALTGKDMPDSQRTISWDKEEDNLDGTFSVVYESSDARFSETIDELPKDSIIIEPSIQ